MKRVSVLVMSVLFAPPAAFAQALSKHEEFVPKSGKGPVVVVISGATGLPYYWSYAQRVAELGYFTVLIDGKGQPSRERRRRRTARRRR